MKNNNIKPNLKLCSSDPLAFFVNEIFNKRILHSDKREALKKMIDQLPPDADLTFAIGNFSLKKEK